MAFTKPFIKDLSEVHSDLSNYYENRDVTMSVNGVAGSPNKFDIVVNFNATNPLTTEATPSGGARIITLDKTDFSKLGIFLTKDNFLEFTWDSTSKTFSGQIDINSNTLGFGKYDLDIVATDENKNILKRNGIVGDIQFEILPNDGATTVKLARPGFETTIDKEFWSAIKNRQLNFKEYFNFVTNVLYRKDRDRDILVDDKSFNRHKRHEASKKSPFVGVKEYNILKFGTEFYMLSKSSLDTDEIENYLAGNDYLPYFGNLSETIDEIRNDYDGNGKEAERIRDQRFNNPFFIELIWSYWMEQGMLMQAMNLINLRFQNVSAGNSNSLSRFDISPLRPLSHMLWGFIQDEQHRLSLPRRVQEYDHEYGLTLIGKAVPSFIAADTRSKFLEAFHNLLTTVATFYIQADDTTRIADAFPVLNVLKEVHLLLAEGNHNAYGNLTWTARHEMLMTQYIIARDEIRIFLGGRPMVPYPEEWMDRIDTVRNMMGWGGTSITYFYDLAIHGEKILLGIRYGNWSDANMPVTSAANWAIDFRDSIQKYIHAYRTVTGIDLSADAPVSTGSRNIQPAVLIQRRVSEERGRLRRA